MWIDNNATDDTLRTWVKHCPAQKLVSTLDGKILWANHAFLEWTQYTLNELVKMTWMQLSVPDKSLEADIDETKNLDAYNPTYQVKKQYIPKGNKPEWGVLTVMRYPLNGPIEYCLCTWEPLRNGTATAFALAMEQSKLVEKKLDEMNTAIQSRNKKTEPTKLRAMVDAIVEWGFENPGKAGTVLMFAISLYSILPQLALRLTLPPQPVQIEVKDKAGNMIPASKELINLMGRDDSYYAG